MLKVIFQIKNYKNRWEAHNLYKLVMKKNLGKIVNLEKYPIHDLQSDKIKKII